MFPEYVGPEYLVSLHPLYNVCIFVSLSLYKVLKLVLWDRMIGPL